MGVIHILMALFLQFLNNHSLHSFTWRLKGTGNKLELCRMPQHNSLGAKQKSPTPVTGTCSSAKSGTIILLCLPLLSHQVSPGEYVAPRIGQKELNKRHTCINFPKYVLINFWLFYNGTGNRENLEGYSISFNSNSSLIS